MYSLFQPNTGVGNIEVFMSKSTIARILITFAEIIPCAPNWITTSGILKELTIRGMKSSQSQLSRDLISYAPQFNVVECGIFDGNKCWQRLDRSINNSKMADAEIMALNLLKEQLDLLPDFVKPYINQKLERMQTQREILRRNVPHHAMFKWEANLFLIRKHEHLGAINKNTLTSLFRCINKNAVLKILSRESPNQYDFLDALTVFEKNGDIYVTGISHLHCNSNYDYRVMDIINAECIAHDSQMKFSNRSKLRA